MSEQALFDHLATGATQVCQCWSITRRDGTTFGFTDHDRDIAFSGIVFVADSGMTARALALTTGLAVDNSEALGLLQSDAISEADIIAGRFDGAEVKNWLVRWNGVADRVLRFTGSIGAINRDGGQFQAELRGLTEALNQPQGRSYLRTCSAVLGDAGCKFDITNPAYTVRTAIAQVSEARSFTVSASGFVDRWFEQGVLEVKTGKAKGLTAVIKHDRKNGITRQITLWSALRADIGDGDEVVLVAGCDKRAETCRVKFDNFINFQGFPDIPGEDWLMSVPRAAETGDGESLSR